MMADLSHSFPVSNQVFIFTHVDAHETWVGDRRAGDAHVHFSGASLAQQVHQRPSRVAAHDAVIDHHYSLINHIFHDHIELERHTLFAQ